MTYKVLVSEVSTYNAYVEAKDRMEAMRLVTLAMDKGLSLPLDEDYSYTEGYKVDDAVEVKVLPSEIECEMCGYEEVGVSLVRDREGHEVIVCSECKEGI